MLRTAQLADRSISLKDRLFVVLTKVDLFDHPDENGNWHWRLALSNFKQQGIHRVYPYAKTWVHQGPDPSHPVMAQLMDFYGSTTPVHGLEHLQQAIETYLSTDVETLDRHVTETIDAEFHELENQLRGALVSVKDALSEREFERRAEQVFDEHFDFVRAGEDPLGLLPEIRRRMSQFMDYELSDQQRHERAKRADQRIKEIRDDLLARLTPQEAEAKRRQMPNPGLMNETAVEIEMRKQMRERVGAKIAGLGEDFRNTARDSIERMLQEMFAKASYEGGRLEVLLPPGKTLVERIDGLGRSGHVSESVVRYQNMEMAKADVAFEVLSRYFARQIIDILDATDPGDRDIREKEMQGLEQFFGMTITDRAAQKGAGIMSQVRAKLDPTGSHDPATMQTGMQSSMQSGDRQNDNASAAGFPSRGAAYFPSSPAAAVRKQPEGQEPGAANDAYDNGHASRDWSRMLGRVRADVDRICNFLEALAKHPRGLQKYHEEAVRTVHDSWIDREGVQSLRRWVRSECTRIWPHKFAAIQAEQQRAMQDIEALEELFASEKPAQTSGPQPR